MVGFDAGGGGTLKRRVPVMVGLINLMNERRTLLCPSALRTMAGRTMSLKFGFSRLQFHRNRGSPTADFGCDESQAMTASIPVRASRDRCSRADLVLTAVLLARVPAR